MATRKPATIIGLPKRPNPNKPTTYSLAPGGAAQPGHVGALPTVNVRQDRPAATPPVPRPAGGQGPVTTTTGPKPISSLPDKSWQQDPVYLGQQSSIQTGLNNLSGYLTQGLGEAALDYGVSYDPNPTIDNPLDVTNVHIDDNVDVTNPFSRAALLMRSHNQNVAGNTNSYAARGQLYAGSLQNAQDAEGFAYQGGRDQLVKGFSDVTRNAFKQWQDAQQAAATAGLDAQASAIDRNKDKPGTTPKEIQAAALSPQSTVAPWLDSAGKPVPLTPLQTAAAKATNSSAGSQQATALWRRAQKDRRLAATLLAKWGPK